MQNRFFVSAFVPFFLSWSDGSGFTPANKIGKQKPAARKFMRFTI